MTKLLIPMLAIFLALLSPATGAPGAEGFAGPPRCTSAGVPGAEKAIATLLHQQALKCAIHYRDRRHPGSRGERHAGNLPRHL